MSTNRTRLLSAITCLGAICLTGVSCRTVTNELERRTIKTATKVVSGAEAAAMRQAETERTISDAIDKKVGGLVTTWTGWALAGGGGLLYAARRKGANNGDDRHRAV